MLVQFMVKNVLSFKDETVIDFSAINAYKEHPCNLISMGAKEKLVRVAVIYGANASGKSNLNIAMKYFQKIIAESFNNVDSNGISAIERYYVPFSFVDELGDSEFQIIIVRGGYEYRYGFEYNDKEIIEEWLYRKNLKTNRTTIVFERGEGKVEFGFIARKECEVYKEQIPHDTLVLSFFNKLKLEIDVFKDVYSEIFGILIVQSNFCEDKRLLQTLLPPLLDDEDEKKKLLQFLMAIDSGIKDVQYDDSESTIKFATFHKGEGGKEYPLRLGCESEGTIKSIMLYIFAKSAIAYGNSLFVDELNVKLHPLLLKMIVDIFYENKSTAQLIYTTHDTTLLDKKFFRRDQIWFVQKDMYGCTELSALSDFKVRSDASFEKDYLAGVYGGIPMLSEFSMEEGE